MNLISFIIIASALATFSTASNENVSNDKTHYATYEFSAVKHCGLVSALNTSTNFQISNNCGVSNLEVTWDDPDQSGTNIRNSPGGSIIAKITPSKCPDGCVINIVGASNGWFKIKGNIEGPEGIGLTLPNGTGWIHGSVISIGTRNYGGQKIRLLDAPKNGRVVGTINEESYGLRVKDLCGSWVKVEYKGKVGWISQEWVCGNPWTTCS